MGIWNICTTGDTPPRGGEVSCRQKLSQNCTREALTFDNIVRIAAIIAILYAFIAYFAPSWGLASTALPVGAAGAGAGIYEIAVWSCKAKKGTDEEASTPGPRAFDTPGGEQKTRKGVDGRRP